MSKKINNLRYFMEDGYVAVRAIDYNSKKVFEGYFDNPQDLYRDACKLNDKGYHSLMSINPINDDFVDDKIVNKLKPIKKGVMDNDINYLSKVMIDLDPVRETNTSSTDEEKAEAYKRAKIIADFLMENDFPQPMICDSGNGYHLFYFIDLDNNAENIKLLKQFLCTLDKFFSDDKVKVDKTTYNASRFTRVYGTVNCKGEEDDERPHRRSKIIERGDDTLVTREQLQAIVSMNQEDAEAKDSNKASVSKDKINIDEWLEKVGLKDSVVKTKPYLDGGKMWIFGQCPWNPEHTNDSAFIVQFPNGAVMAKCHHDSCSEQNWRTLREKYDPKNCNKEDEEQPKGIKLVIKRVEEDGTEFLIDQNSCACAKIKLRDYTEYVKLTESKFSSYLQRLYFNECGMPLKADAIKQVVNLFTMRAEINETRKKINKRIATYVEKNYIYYDLMNSKGTLVKVTQKGIKLVQSKRICFAKSKNMEEQVKPKLNVKPKKLVKLLKKHFRFKSESDAIMFSTYLVSAFFEDIQHPILVIFGEKGSSKSTSLKKLKRIVDPGFQELLTLPSKSKDLVITLSNNYLSCFDNLQYLSSKVSDLLCMAVTGGAYSDRVLYTNDEENLICFKSVIALNGINIVTTKPDIVDRSIFIEFERISEEERRSEAAIWAEFDEDLPKILGAIFNTISVVLGMEEEPEINSVGRLVDFTYLGYKVAEVLNIGGDKFVDAYLKNQNKANDEALSAHPVGAAILSLMADKHQYKNSVTKLLKDIEEIAKNEMLDTTSRVWPKDAASLSRRLREIKSNLGQKSIFYDIKNIGPYNEITMCNRKVDKPVDKPIDDDDLDL